MSLHSLQPIGIFDSGVGGLTVAAAIAKQLPHENIIYFGDSAHLPYGEKSTAAIQAYTIKICDMLLQQKCKLILIACNSASAAAYELAKEYIASKALVVNVIDPVIYYLREHFANACIGLIGTRQTVNSNIYKKKIDGLHLNIDLRALATPLLVPVIEEGLVESPIIREVLGHYLSHPSLHAVQALVLACTHYPLIKTEITRFFKRDITLIDNADISAHAVKGLLTHHHLIAKRLSPDYQFYSSDYTDAFANSAKWFFPKAVHFEHYPLWE